MGPFFPNRTGPVRSGSEGRSGCGHRGHMSPPYPTCLAGEEPGHPSKRCRDAVSASPAHLPEQTPATAVVRVKVRCVLTEAIDAFRKACE
jgi:hypothetical protein